MRELIRSLVVLVAMAAVACGGGGDDSADAGPDASDAAPDCAQGCLVDGVCYPDGVTDPANPCRICDPDRADADWSDRDGAACVQ